MSYFVLQLILFTPLYLVWRNDCKTIGRDRLAVNISERFIAWIVFCPIWAIPLIK